MRMLCCLTVALTSAALAAPALAGGAQDLRSPDAIDAAPVSRTVPGGSQDRRSPDAIDAATRVPLRVMVVPVREPTPVQQSSTGLEAGSVAIGAGGMLGLLAVGAGGTLVLRRNRAKVLPLAH
jgi:hypothetical protein